MILIFISIVLFIINRRNNINIPQPQFFMNDWEVRSESLLEYYAWKKYRELKLSIQNNSENIYDDPFSEDGLKFSNQFDIYYSIGPDRVDQFLEVIYDPTNGVFSAGDIEVKKRNS